MTNRITGVNGPVVAPAERSATKGRETTDGAAPASRAPADGVKLTPAAREVQAAAATLASTPVVDDARVEAVRLELERGEYRADPARIAGKLLDFDKQV